MKRRWISSLHAEQLRDNTLIYKHTRGMGDILLPIVSGKWFIKSRYDKDAARLYSLLTLDLYRILIINLGDQGSRGVYISHLLYIFQSE